MTQPGIPFDLAAGNYVAVTCAARRGQRICWDVRAPRAIAVYVLDAENFDAFEADEHWQWDAGHGHLRIHQFEYDVPSEDDWIVLIHNTSEDTVPVFYEVWIE